MWQAIEGRAAGQASDASAPVAVVRLFAKGSPSERSSTGRKRGCPFVRCDGSNMKLVAPTKTKGRGKRPRLQRLCRERRPSQSRS